MSLRVAARSHAQGVGSKYEVGPEVVFSFRLPPSVVAPGRHTACVGLRTRNLELEEPVTLMDLDLEVDYVGGDEPDQEHAHASRL